MIGIEFVRDRSSREPHPELAKHVMGHMRANRVLVSVDGPHASVIKLKPPMCITSADMDMMTDALDAALQDFAVSQRTPRAARDNRAASNRLSQALPSLDVILRRAERVGVPSHPPTGTADASHASAAPATTSAAAATKALASMLQRQKEAA